jgi:hypothetical protein
MSGCKIFIKDVYARPLGNQIMYWRINSQDMEKGLLEWVVVDAGRNLGANLFQEDHPPAIAVMKNLQRPERMVVMNDINEHMLEHFLEWGWIQPH